jgi:hypothetical protein
MVGRDAGEVLFPVNTTRARTLGDFAFQKFVWSEGGLYATAAPCCLAGSFF